MREGGRELAWQGRDGGVWAGKTWKDIRRKKEQKWMDGGVSKGRSWRGKKRTGVEAVCQRKKKSVGKESGQWNTVASGRDWDVSVRGSAKPKTGW